MANTAVRARQARLLPDGASIRHITLEYLDGRRKANGGLRAEPKIHTSDPDAEYCRTITIDVEKLSPVIAVEIAHESGCFNRIVSLLAAEGINIQYAYTCHGGPLGIFILKTDRVEMLRAVEVLEGDGVKVVDAV